MSGTKHTPGPWRTGDMFNTVFGPPNGQPCPEVIATVSKGNKANARLLAAAPELLRALTNLLDAVTDNRMHGPEIYAAAVAIAKAEGSK